MIDRWWWSDELDGLLKTVMIYPSCDTALDYCTQRASGVTSKVNEMPFD